MHLPTLTATLLLPLLAVAQSVTSTMITTYTKTITISEVVGTSTVTFSSYNATSMTAPSGTGSVGTVSVVSVTGTGGISTSSATGSSPTGSTTSPPINGASSLSGAHVGAAGLVVALVAALL